MTSIPPVDDVLAWLDTLPPVQQARVLAAMLDRRNIAVLTARRARLVHGLTRHATYDEVAADLGVTVHAVLDAVKTHNRLVAATNHPPVRPAANGDTS